MFNIKNRRFKREISEADVRSHFDRASNNRAAGLHVKSLDNYGYWFKRNLVIQSIINLKGKVLDVGCNEGTLEESFRQHYPNHNHVEFIGIDISSKAIERAKAKSIPGATFFVTQGSELSFNSNEFDAVLLIEVIEHVNDKIKLLCEIARVLKPGGIFIMTTPNPCCLALQSEMILYATARWILRRPNVVKDDYISSDELLSFIEMSFPGSKFLVRFIWPRPYVTFGKRNIWGILPPCPPSVLLAVQQWLCKLDLDKYLPEQIKHWIFWTLWVEVEK